MISISKQKLSYLMSKKPTFKQVYDLIIEPIIVIQKDDISSNFFAWHTLIICNDTLYYISFIQELHSLGQRDLWEYSQRLQEVPVEN